MNIRKPQPKPEPKAEKPFVIKVPAQDTTHFEVLVGEMKTLMGQHSKDMKSLVSSFKIDPPSVVVNNEMPARKKAKWKFTVERDINNNLKTITAEEI